MSSSYFFRLEKKHSADHFISGLRADDGSLVTGQKDLCAAFGALYADLFSAGSVDAEAQVELLSHFSSPLPKNEHIGEELASVVASSPRVDALGPGTEVPSDDVDAQSVANESVSVISMTVSSAGEDHCSAAFIDDSVRAAGAPHKRKHCSGSGDNDKRVPPKVAGRSSYEPILDSAGDHRTLLGQLFCEASAVDSPWCIPNSAVDRRAEVTFALGADLLGPTPLSADPLPREPAILEDGLLGTPL